jgi:peptide chain release factor 3
MPAAAASWPIGCGLNFQGVYDILENTVYLYKEKTEMKLGPDGVFGPELESIVTQFNLKELRDEMELLQGAGYPVDKEMILAGELTPVFFGSALADFGVTCFLEHFLDMSPAPGNRKLTDGEVNPLDDFFSGFIFKIQANMNPAHRDRLAFFRICSGEFEKGMTCTLSRTGKPIKIAQSTQLMANERENVESALPGDVIGIYDTGNFQIGDTLSTSKDRIFFEPLPTFPPELFCMVAPRDTMKTKQFAKGVEQLSQEGAIQVYHNEYNEVVIGAVGQLQFEVFEYRLKNEYNAELRMTPLEFSLARWIVDSDMDFVKSKLDSRTMLVFDRFERPLLLFANQFTLNYYQERYPEIKLTEAMDLERIAETE